MDQAGQVRAVTADELTLAGLPGHPGRCGLQRPADRHVHLKLAQPLTGGRHRGHRDTTLDRLHPEVVTRVHRTPRNRGRAGAPGHHRRQHHPGHHHLGGTVTPPGAGPRHNRRNSSRACGLSRVWLPASPAVAVSTACPAPYRCSRTVAPSVRAISRCSSPPSPFPFGRIGRHPVSPAVWRGGNHSNRVTPRCSTCWCARSLR